MKKKSIVLAIYADPKIYPPTIHTANILCEKGWKVYLVGIKDPSAPENIFINPVVKQIYCGTQSAGVKNKINYLRFCFFVWWLALSGNIRVLIAYDAAAVFPVYWSSLLTFKKWIYHQHDYFENPRSFFQRFTLSCEQKYSRKAWQVIFPQQQRAAIFAQKNKLTKAPLIVFNGPRQSWINDTQPINEQISRIRAQFKFLLVYQGGWSKYFGIANLIRAISFCKVDVAVVLMGKELEKGVRAYYEGLAVENKVNDRFLFLEHVPYDQLPSVTRYCDAGIAKLTNDNDLAPLNDRFVIGASNKVTEYIACGLPVISCVSEPNELFFKQYPIGIMCDVEDRVKFAEAIDALLSDRERVEAIGKNNQEIFLTSLNYDVQFSKVNDELEKLVLISK